MPAQRINQKRTTLKLTNSVQVREAKKSGGGQVGKLQTEEGQGLVTGEVVEVAIQRTYVTIKSRPYTVEEVLDQLAGEADSIEVSGSDIEVKVKVVA